MKKGLLFVLLLVSLIGFGQCPSNGPIIISSQAEIDAFAVNYPGCNSLNVDLLVSGNDVVDLSGLSQITATTRQLSISYSSIQNLDGLGAIQFIGEYASIYLYQNFLLENLNGLSQSTGVDIASIEIFDCNLLSNLNGLGGFQSVGEIRIGNEGLVSLAGLEGLTHMDHLQLWGNSSLISLSGLQNVTGHVYSIQLFDNLVLPNLIGLDGIDDIADLTLTSNSGLYSLDGLDNVTNLNLNPNSRGFYFIAEDNNSLMDITALENINDQNIDRFILMNNSNLSYCSILPFCNHLTNGGAYYFSGNAFGCDNWGQVVSKCYEVLNTISGAVKFDYDANGCALSSYEASSILVKATKGTNVYTTTTDSDGNFSLFVPEDGVYRTTLIPDSFPDNFEATPTFIDTDFIGFGNNEELDFCLTATESFNDLKVILIPLNDARPGFNSNYRLIYQNLGTTNQNGEIILKFDNTRQEFLSAEPAPTSVVGNTITWGYTNFLPFQYGVINMNFNTFQPPTNNSGDVLEFETIINPITGDATPEDNIYNLEQIVVNSYDPNDKQVNQGEEIYESEKTNYLDYMVRFQNTGTADAINVRIEDVLSDKLDWNTFRPLTASHNYRVEILDGNNVSFIFDNINLPPEVLDPEGSNGFVAFQIKPVQNIALGDVIENTADIYFDFNAAIVTNTVSTTVVENLGVAEFGLDALVHLYPNPISSTLNIKTSENISFEKAKVYSTLGKLILETSEKQINFETLSAGFYFVEIATNKGNVTKKIIKK